MSFCMHTTSNAIAGTIATAGATAASQTITGDWGISIAVLIGIGSAMVWLIWNVATYKMKVDAMLERLARHLGEIEEKCPKIKGRRSIACDREDE